MRYGGGVTTALVSAAAALGCSVVAPLGATAVPIPTACYCLASLPVAARGPIAAALWRDAQAYRRATYPLRIDPFIQQGELTGSHGTRGEEFGESVSISGDTIVVGTPNYAIPPTNKEQGAAYVFVKPASGWASATQTAELAASNGTAGDGLGRSVGVSGETILAGAPDHQVGKTLAQGAMYTFIAS